MRRRFSTRCLLLALSLLLLGGQQAAVAHLIGHAGVAAQAVAQQGDDEHGAALALSHVCSACIAFAALNAAPPAHFLPPPVAAGTATPAPARQACRAAPPRRAYAARAPPILL